MDNTKNRYSSDYHANVSPISYGVPAKRDDSNYWMALVEAYSTRGQLIAQETFRFKAASREYAELEAKKLAMQKFSKYRSEYGNLKLEVVSLDIS